MRNKNENKRRRDLRTIRIKQETSIPGTDYVLEAGDRISIESGEKAPLKERGLKENYLIFHDLMKNYSGEPSDIGFLFGSDLGLYTWEYYNDDELRNEFFRGLKKALRDYK